jgi:hypothetical protein
MVPAVLQAKHLSGTGPVRGNKNPGRTSLTASNGFPALGPRLRAVRLPGAG